MNMEQFASYRLDLPPSIPSILLGGPGTGKTSAAMLFAKYLQEAHANARVVYCDLASKMPEDFTGLPYYHEIKDLKVTRYAPMDEIAWLMADGPAGKDPYGLLVLDDFAAAQPATLVTMFGALSPDRIVGGHKLSKNLFIICTGNRREDKADAQTIPSPILNRCEVRGDVKADHEGWGTWAIENGVAPWLVGFIKFRPSLLHQEVDKSDEMGRFATPRSWANLGFAWDAAVKHGCISSTAACLVGNSGCEAVAFWNLRSTMDPAKILDGNELTADEREDLRSSPDKAVSLATALAEHANERGPDELLAVKLLTALAVNIPMEYGASGLRHFLMLNPANLEPLNLANFGGKLDGTPGGKLFSSACSALLGEDED